MPLNPNRPADQASTQLRRFIRKASAGASFSAIGLGAAAILTSLLTIDSRFVNDFLKNNGLDTYLPPGMDKKIPADYLSSFVRKLNSGVDLTSTTFPYIKKEFQASVALSVLCLVLGYLDKNPDQIQNIRGRIALQVNTLYELISQRSVSNRLPDLRGIRNRVASLFGQDPAQNTLLPTTAASTSTATAALPRLRRRR